MPRDTQAKNVAKAGYQAKDADSPYTFILSTEDVDRDGDVVVQSGIDLKDFKKNPIALSSHDPTRAIGVWENVRVEGKKLLGDLKLARKGTSQLIDVVRELIEQRILRAVSIGFQIDDMEPRKEGGWTFGKTRLLEASLVSIPANQNALRIKAAKIVPDELRSVFLPEDDEGRSVRARKDVQGNDPTTKTSQAGASTPSTSDKRKTPMNIAQRIQVKRDRLIAIKDRVTEIKALLEADDEYELTDDETAEMELLASEQADVIKSIETLQSTEDMLKQNAVPAAAQKANPAAARPGSPAAAKTAEKGGALLVKSIVVNLVAHMTQQHPSEIMDQMYGDDDRVKAVHKFYGNKRRMVQKTGVDAADTTTAGWAAELVQDDLQGFLEELRAVSIYAGLLNAPGASGLSFGGAGTITIPRRNRTNQSDGVANHLAAQSLAGSQMGGSWVGEGGVIPVKALALGSQTLSRFKLAVISAMTNEILEQSVPNIEGIVRSAILEDTALVVDAALLDGAATVAGVRPASVFNGAVTQASAGATAAQIVADVKFLMGAMSAINGASPVLIMNSNRLLGLSTVTTAAGGFMFRDEIAQGRLLGVPVLSATTVNPAAVGIVDAGSFVGANDAPAFSISDQATLTMANADGTAPTQAGDASDHTGGGLGDAEQVPPDGGIVVTGDTGGAPTGASVVGYGAQSMWQQNQSAIRMIMPASWGMVRTGGSAWLSGVTW